MALLLDPMTVNRLRNLLYAYLHIYGEDDRIENVRAIAGSILAVEETVGRLVLQGLVIESWIEAIVADFDPSHIAASVWSEAEAIVAQQVKNWRQTLELKVKNTLEAYIQKYVPKLDIAQVQTTILTILPIVEEAHISRDEAKQIIQRVSSTVDWQSTVSRVVDPKWLALAGVVWQCRHNRDVEATVQDIVQAYVAKFQPTLIEMGEGLAEQALTALFNSQTQLDIDIALDAESRRLLLRQVSFKMTFLEASPPSSKTAMEIAQQLHAEVTRYRAEQGAANSNAFPTVIRCDDSERVSAIGGPMSIGIVIKPNASSKTESIEDGKRES